MQTATNRCHSCGTYFFGKTCHNCGCSIGAVRDNDELDYNIVLTRIYHDIDNIEDIDG